MNLRPLEDRIVVRPLESADKTPGGLLLPDQAKEKPRRGVVLAVGPGKFGNDGPQWRRPMDVAINQVVCYSAYAGNEITQPDGSKILILSQSDVLAIVDLDPLSAASQL